MRLIKTKGRIAVVEHGGDRRIVPIEEKDNPEAFEAGMPWGIPWEAVELSASSQDLAAELRRRGIWSIEDLRQNPKGAMGALQATYGVDVAMLFQFAAKYEEVT